jgi:hypothetical protein
MIRIEAENALKMTETEMLEIRSRRWPRWRTLVAGQMISAHCLLFS